MNTAPIGVGRQFERLFGIGAVGALSDAELIERFAAVDVDDEAAAAAFEAIVAQHGPMILRVCHKFLRDAHAAEDAFQATFLVLAHGHARSAAASSWEAGSMESLCELRARRGSRRRGERPAIASRPASAPKQDSNLSPTNARKG